MQAWYRYRSIVLGVALTGVLLGLVAWPFLARLTGNHVFYVTLMGTALISAILVISLNIAMGYTGLLSIIHTGLLALGGYLSGYVTISLGWSAWIGVVGAVLLAAAFAAFVTLVSLRATYLYFGMITLAFNLVIVEVAREWEGVTGGFFGLVGISRPSVFGTRLSVNAFYYVILVFAGLAYVFQRNVIRSRAGRAFQAVRESGDAAAALGIRVSATKLVSFTLAGGLAGLAGALFAHLNGFMNPDVGLLDNALVLFIGLLLGGTGTLAGPPLGVGLFSLVDALLRDYATYRRLILGVILLAAMVVIPRGIVGTWRASRLGRDLYDDRPRATDQRRDAGATLDAAEHASPGQTVVEARRVSKRFGGVQALRDVDVTVIGQTIHGIIGPNGSGKSTLINCVTRFLPFDAGEVLLFGEPAPATPQTVAAAGVVRVFQVPHLFERVSVVDNVLTGMHMPSRQNWLTAALRLPGFRREERQLRERARDLLALGGLDAYADWPASSISHGQKRLLEVVRALAAQPRVLILDEPATGLTSEEVASLGDVIRGLRDHGLTIVLIEHNLAFVMGVCDRITVLEQGEVIADGPPQEVRASPEVQEAYLGPAVEEMH
jgi:ABC-type branched-subunit amino acid transport system ATPase component/ABC-type branched-subunit amino acid transport system permease subunit